MVVKAGEVQLIRLSDKVKGGNNRRKERCVCVLLGNGAVHRKQAHVVLVAEGQETCLAKHVLPA